MKTLVSILICSFTSFFCIAQESVDTTSSTDTDSTSTNSENTQAGIGNTSTHTHKYFIATNSGLKTPVGFRVGVLDRMGGYIATRFGKGFKYDEDIFNPMEPAEATLFSASAGLMFPITIRKTLKLHTFLGLGYGKWFDRPSKSGQTVGVEFEGGLMVSYQKFMVNLGGTVLTGDGNSPKGDMTFGVGFKF